MNNSNIDQRQTKRPIFRQWRKSRNPIIICSEDFNPKPNSNSVTDSTDNRSTSQEDDDKPKNK